jgi:hypothetical protein
MEDGKHNQCRQKGSTPKEANVLHHCLVAVAPGHRTGQSSGCHAWSLHRATTWPSRLAIMPGRHARPSPGHRLATAFSVWAPPCIEQLRRRERDFWLRREQNECTGEKGEDISGEKRLGFGERRERVDMSCHKRRYFSPPRSSVPKFQSPREQLTVEPSFGVGDLK